MREFSMLKFNRRLDNLNVNWVLMMLHNCIDVSLDVLKCDLCSWNESVQKSSINGWIV